MRLPFVQGPVILSLKYKSLPRLVGRSGSGWFKFKLTVTLNLNSLAQGAQFDLIYSSFDLLAIPFVCTMPAFPSSFFHILGSFIGQIF